MALLPGLIFNAKNTSHILRDILLKMIADFGSEKILILNVELGVISYLQYDQILFSPLISAVQIFTITCSNTVLPSDSNNQSRKTSYLVLKFRYSEKATKFCKISTLLLSVCTVYKSKVKISHNFVAFSEYMNFT